LVRHEKINENIKNIQCLLPSPDKLKNKLISKVKEKTPAAALCKSNFCA
jgi:hypothetical protein